jgi:hypothetical protein
MKTIDFTNATFMNRTLLQAPCRAAAFLWLVLLTAWPALTPRAASSSPPTNMTYQAYITKADGSALGSPLAQNYDIIFRVYGSASQSDTTVLWSERQTVTVTSGYLSVLLGAGTQQGSENHGLLPAVFQSATASDRFMGLWIVGQGSPGDLEILPRLQMLPGPYSYLATTAKQLDAATTNRLNDNLLYLRPASDTNNGLAYSSLFGTSAIDGPKLFGNKSGVLGTTLDGEQTVLRWERFSPTDARVAINKAGLPNVALDVNGTVAATLFNGSGAGLTALNAANITSGILPLARIPSLDASQIGTGQLDGARILSLDAAKLTGTIDDARLSSAVVVSNKTPTFAAGLNLVSSVNGLLIRTGSGTAATFGKFTSLDGPVLFGRTDGVLGTRTAPLASQEKGVLKWNSTGVEIIGQSGDLNVAYSVSAIATPPDWTRAKQLVVRPDNSTQDHISIGTVRRLVANAPVGLPNYPDTIFGVIQAFDSDTSVTTLQLNPLGGAVVASISAPSDRNIKTGFTPVDAREILEKVAEMPVTSWSYTNSASIKHIGPVAQDFKAAFGLGANDVTINTVDAQGVALAAIQGLNSIVREKDAELQSVKKEVQELKAMVEQLARLNGTKP